ncbi:MAG TPA: STAS domain-containing protein [Tepidisphaeraceae bacterium]|jgi:anti-anti-sigma factor
MKQQFNDYILRTEGDVTIVRLRTENLLNILDVNRVSEEITHLIVDGGVRRLILDLKYVRHTGSAALGMLLSLLQDLRKRQGKLVLSHIENIEPLLRASNTRKLFTIAPDPREAMALFDK